MFFSLFFIIIIIFIKFYILSLVSPANSKLCFLWDEPAGRTHMWLHYTKFSVCHGDSPHIVIEDQQKVYIEAYFMVNVVAFDPCSDEESSSCASSLFL